MFLARVIRPAKWKVTQNLSDGEIPADAITADLRTMDNALSFWECGLGEDEALDDVAIAIASSRERIDKLDLVWISNDEIEAQYLETTHTRGETPFSELSRKHVDICGLDYVRLGKLAMIVSSALRDRQFRRLSEGKVKRLLIDAVRENRVELPDLREKVHQVINTALQSERGN